MKKSNKVVIIEVVESLGAKLVNGMYEMTKSQYDMLDAKLGNIGADYKFANNKKDDTLKAIYSAKNCRILKIKIVAEKRKVVKKAVKKTDKKDGIMVKFNGLIAGKRVQKTAYVNDVKEIAEKMNNLCIEWGFEYIRSYAVFSDNKHWKINTVSLKIAA